MSTFLTTAATMQTLSIAGMEEASREGRRDGDIEHLLLALVISDQSAGDALRSLGITLDAARCAVRDQHDSHLRQLGIDLERAEAGRIVFHETEGYDWTDRARTILNRSTEKPGKGDAASVLRQLIDEPSGLIADILERLGTTTDAVRTALDEAEAAAASDSPSAPRRRDWVHGRIRTYVPAPVEDVWALVSDADRFDEWDPAIGDIAAASDDADVWIGVSPTHRPNGKPLKVRSEFRRRRITQREATTLTRVIWWCEFPDAPDVAPRMLAVELETTEGGTFVTLTSTWRRRAGWRRLAGLPLRALQKYLVWLNLSQMSGAISRVFR
ncbi:Clp protease N-terminal domain-containing protein [Microbacterium sp.]|uniref:SRPBCC family protein n=1 Tax=Microbacterium sp. TaxID=51671 RepID=UPI00260C6E58|nr:Clp protease N-terminal domain-containing protein [Microbacterium sp.]